MTKTSKLNSLSGICTTCIENILTPASAVKVCLRKYDGKPTKQSKVVRFISDNGSVTRRELIEKFSLNEGEEYQNRLHRGYLSDLLQRLRLGGLVKHNEEGKYVLTNLGAQSIILADTAKDLGIL